MPKGLVNLPPWITTEGVLIVGGLLWAILSQFIPAVGTLEVPAIAGVTPTFDIAPGHMVALGLVPVAVKMIGKNTTPFIGARAEAPPEDPKP